MTCFYHSFLLTSSGLGFAVGCHAQQGALLDKPVALPTYWGLRADVGAASFNVTPLNTFFAATTPARLPSAGASTSLHLLASNAVFGYGSLYYEHAVTTPDLLAATPTFSLEAHTVGFALHKVLVDKRVKVVLPSLGVGYRLLNLTYNRNGAAITSLDSLWQRPGSFTLRARTMVAQGGAGIYYTFRDVSWLGQGELDLGLAGAYAYTFDRGTWFLLGTQTAVPVPRQRLDYYTLNLSLSVLLNR
ncbi:hypothetical protein [Hymenobacter crusticola]|uniref:Outer membrane protein beta-barrel domain-containing protein n=1 Tax=Hymenobacter crusticola TaxID=1770526 RepID=A0A2C9ZTT0_9BACT|nr:hypothetical protein [Hymenobacter crusticola]OUJ68301.1 hypothetical protein BXP70_28055 [Hymenobacter crusticola]